jgi:serpin B
VLHEAFVAVDESGTEAPAATAVVMRAVSGTFSPHALVCDRPFLFVLHDTAHGTPLFVGRVADPTA